MATVTVPSRAVSSGRITLEAGVESTVTFTDNVGRVQVWTDGASPVYLTTDGRPATVDGQHCYEVPPGAIGEYDTANTPSGDVVRLISAQPSVVRVELA